jgi:sigma-E factor negative regulatory protein RseA
MKDELSAFLDSDLDEETSRQVLDSISRDSTLRERFETYTLIGDVLRGDVAGSPGFADRVMARLNDEPTVLAPQSAPAPGRREGGLWKSVMPLAASLMGVAAVGWVAYTLFPQAEIGNSIAATPPGASRVAEVAAQASTVRMTERDDPHRKYVFVHQATSGGGPISGAVQYVRTVSDVRGDAHR